MAPATRTILTFLVLLLFILVVFWRSSLVLTNNSSSIDDVVRKVKKKDGPPKPLTRSEEETIRKQLNDAFQSWASTTAAASEFDSNNNNNNNESSSNSTSTKDDGNEESEKNDPFRSVRGVKTPSFDSTILFPLIPRKRPKRPELTIIPTNFSTSQLVDKSRNNNKKKNNNKDQEGGTRRKDQDWIIVKRSQAFKIWKSHFGTRWSCGLETEPLSSSDSSSSSSSSSSSRQHESTQYHQQSQQLQQQQKEILQELHKSLLESSKLRKKQRALLAKYQSQDEIRRVRGDAKVQWPINFVLWNSSQMFLRCSPRHPHMYKFASAPVSAASAVWTTATSVSKIFVRSLTTPAIGAACLRELLVLDGRSSSLEEALSRRCFLRKIPFSSSSSSSSSSSLTPPFVLGIGHSHTRYLSAMLCMSVNLSWCSDFTSIQRLPFYPVHSTDVMDSVASADARNRATMFLAYASSYYDQRRSLVRLLEFLLSGLPKDLGKKPPLVLDNFSSVHLGMDDLTRQDAIDSSISDWVLNSALHRLKKANRVPTHFVISRGEWDMLYLNPNPASMAMQIRRFLLLINRVFPDAKIIFQLPQIHVPTMSSSSSSGGHSSVKERAKNLMRAQWRNTCSSQTRIDLLRHACICAAASTSTKHLLLFSSNNNDNRRNLVKNLILFDSNRVTKSHFGFTFVDSTGHHYIDEALEVLAQELRRIIEREDVAEEYVKDTEKFLLRVWKTEKRNTAAARKEQEDQEDSPEEEHEEEKDEEEKEQQQQQDAEFSCQQVKKAGEEFDKSFEDASNIPISGAHVRKCSCHRDSPEDPRFCRGTKILGRDVG